MRVLNFCVWITVGMVMAEGFVICCMISAAFILLSREAFRAVG